MRVCRSRDGQVDGMGARAWPHISAAGEFPAADQSGPADVNVLVGGRYRLRERLGEQDGSLTWRAVDEALNRPVMVWTFLPGFPRAGAVVAAASAACQLADPRLALIFDADDEGELPYVVAEWPAGRPLDEVLLAAGPGEPDRAAAMVMQAAGAIAAAHAFGLAHLRLRPSSLWQRGTGEITVTGLGVAAALAGIESAEPARADTRGLGQLLYATLTGYWPGTEQTALPAAPRQGQRLCTPRQIRAGIPGGLDAIVCRALPEAARDAGPPIVDPVRLADELAKATGAYSRRGRGATTWPAAPYRRSRPPAATPGPARTPGTARTAADPMPVTRAEWACPPPRSAEPRPVRRHPVTGPGWPPPTQPMRPARGRGGRGKAVLAAALALAAVALAAGGWSVARHGTGAEKAGIGTGPSASAHHTAVLAGTAGQPMRPVSAQAFDPYGEADNSQLAPLAIDHDLATAWQTEWYATAAFGNLKPGTGLLLDMGRVVTISGARILLGSAPGASFQLRAGMSAWSLADLPVLASKTGAGGWVSIRLRAVHARYVVLWFTRLPPDASGTFQVSVFDVRLEGWS